MPESPEPSSNESTPQDMNLEAQLDALLSDLEAVDPQTVPADLRKQKPVEELELDEDTQKEPDPEPVAEAVEPVAVEPQPEPIPEPAVEAVEPVEAEPQPEPVPVAAQSAEAEPQNETGADLDDIASLAASLLDQQIDRTIDSAASTEADTVKESTPPAEPTPANEAQQTVTETVAEAPAISEPEPAKKEKPKALSEDELSAQINALLSNVQSVSAAPTEPAAEPSQAAPADEPQPAQVEVSAESRVEEASADDTGPVSIDQIDAMLAESAERAIEQAPEPEHVPGTDEILAAQAQAEAAEAEAQSQAEAETQALEAATEPQPAPAEIETGAEAQAEPAPEPAPAEAYNAGAEDVAKELDADAQAAPAAVSEPAPQEESEAIEPVAARMAGDDAGQDPDASGLSKAGLMLLRVCAKINSPLNRLSPEMRDTVGWVGVVTLGLGLAIFVYGLVF